MARTTLIDSNEKVILSYSEDHRNIGKKNQGIKLELDRGE